MTASIDRDSVILAITLHHAAFVDGGFGNRRRGVGFRPGGFPGHDRSGRAIQAGQ
ncbi:MAG: hypothetical protein RQ741_11505 [Wenzhouxiangellaceae bacterium]|nr:hypothetical protein [Wenzhouxiangellaceae bacterium]